jgi:hypothetical protein
MTTPAPITHREWAREMAAIRDALDTILVPGLEHMKAGLASVGAGRDQMNEMGTWIGNVGELADEGTNILGDHGPRLRRVSEAQAAAGGVTQVARDKRYNQR